MRDIPCKITQLRPDQYDSYQDGIIRGNCVIENEQMEFRTCNIVAMRWSGLELL